MNRQDVVQNGRVQDIVHCSEVGFTALNHCQNLPAVLAVSADATEGCPAIELQVVEHAGRDVLDELGPIGDDHIIHANYAVVVLGHVHVTHLIILLRLIKRTLELKAETRRSVAQQVLQELTTSLPLLRRKLLFESLARLVELFEVGALAEVNRVLTSLPDEPLQELDLRVQLLLYLLGAANLEVTALHEDALLTQAWVQRVIVTDRVVGIHLGGCIFDIAGCFVILIVYDASVGTQLDDKLVSILSTRIFFLLCLLVTLDLGALEKAINDDFDGNQLVVAA